MRRIEFFVPGVAKPKGTLISGVRKDGRRFQRSLDKGHSDWKARVSVAAEAAMDGDEMTEGPVRLYLTFLSVRPKKHFYTGKRSKVMRDDAPPIPTAKPDVDKLTRMILDALTSIVYKDDAQVSCALIKKRYADAPGLKVVAKRDKL